MRMAHASLTARLNKLETETRELVHALDQLHKDAETAESLSRAMKADDIETYLAPVNRLSVAAGLEPLARAARLSSFTYKLSPGRAPENDYALADADGLVESAIMFEAEAPHDLAVYRFVTHMARQLPGRTRLRALTLERMNLNEKETLSALNVRAIATIDWLANKPGVTERP